MVVRKTLASRGDSVHKDHVKDFCFIRLLYYAFIINLSLLRHDQLVLKQKAV